MIRRGRQVEFFGEVIAFISTGPPELSNEGEATAKDRTMDSTQRFYTAPIGTKRQT